MNISIFQARLPSGDYAQLKERAYQQRKSINALVVEAVRKLLEDERRERTAIKQPPEGGGEPEKGETR